MFKKEKFLENVLSVLRVLLLVGFAPLILILVGSIIFGVLLRALIDDEKEGPCHYLSSREYGNVIAFAPDAESGERFGTEQPGTKEPSKFNPWQACPELLPVKTEITPEHKQELVALLEVLGGKKEDFDVPMVTEEWAELDEALIESCTFIPEPNDIRKNGEGNAKHH